MLNHRIKPREINFSIQKKAQQGFTLIETIVGIVVFSISLSIITSLIVPAERNSVDQIHQIKASELAQALMDDIMSRAFDENSDMAGGRIRCGENGTVCTAANALGPDEGNNRLAFDDVDDFNGYNQLVDTSSNNLDGGYSSFTINVTVNYPPDNNNDGNDDELGLANGLAKRIDITVTTPAGTAGTQITYTVYKTNF
jgi:MSHA pilin protein MshD